MYLVVFGHLSPGQMGTRHLGPGQLGTWSKWASGKMGIWGNDEHYGTWAPKQMDIWGIMENL